MKIAWLTDIHLNFLNDLQIKHFCNKIQNSGADAIFLTGDISEAPGLIIHMRMMEMYCKMPIYFICGNHDYYRASVKKFRKTLNKQFGSNCHPDNSTYWMNEHGIISLTSDVAVVGHDGWYDGGYASFFGSQLLMNDHRLIEEIRYDTLNTFQRDHYKSCLEFAKEGADHVKQYLLEAFKEHDTVYFLTHAPPFRENSRAPDGTLSNKDWLPFFSSKCMGDALLEVMDSAPPTKTLNVLCGHTHTFWNHQPRSNITCITGNAIYGQPEVCMIFELE